MKKVFRLFFAIAILAVAVFVLKPYLGNSVDIGKLQDLGGTVELGLLPTADDAPTRSQDDMEVPPDLHGPYDVAYVIDGDTAYIDIDGTETKVRFIGIDTPESVHQDESRNTPEGKVASDFTKKLLTGKKVYLEYDITPQDDYGRTLAYVYLDDGKTMAQEEILRAGMATTLTIQPNSKYASHFYEIQVEAREAGAGFWATGFFN